MARAPGYRSPGNWTTLKRHILNRDNHHCYICGGEATTVDHIVPVSQGGNHSHDNLVAICLPCHTVKTDTERRAGIAKRTAQTQRAPIAEPHPNQI